MLQATMYDIPSITRQGLRRISIVGTEVGFEGCNSLQFVKRLSIVHFFRGIVHHTSVPVTFSKKCDPRVVVSFTGPLKVKLADSKRCFSVRLARTIGDTSTIEEVGRTYRVRKVRVMDVHEVTRRGGVAKVAVLTKTSCLASIEGKTFPRN